jgi:hypothetical protein
MDGQLCTGGDSTSLTTNKLHGAEPFLRSCHSAGQEITRLEVHHSVNIIPPLDPILSEFNPLHNLISQVVFGFRFSD